MVSNIEVSNGVRSLTLLGFVKLKMCAETSVRAGGVEDQANPSQYVYFTVR